jgi:hypothetical protein
LLSPPKLSSVLATAPASFDRGVGFVFDRGVGFVFDRGVGFS